MSIIYTMKNRKYLTLVLLFLTLLKGYSQNSKEDWVTFVSKKNKGMMTVLVNLQYDYAKPNYKNVLIVGTHINNCYKNGYPKSQGLENIYSFSDSIATIISQHTKNRLAGIITYQCTGFDIYYVKDTLQIRSAIQHYFDRDYKKSKNYLVIERDKKWKYYKENLLPKNDWTDDYFMNQDLLSQLVSEGDNLALARKVSHWINFTKAKKRQQFIKKIKEFKFTIDSLSFKKETKSPFVVKISIQDNLIPSNLLKITALVKLIAKSTSGTYDGWGAEPVIENKR